MKIKRLLAAAVAAAVSVSYITVPVMAAEDYGTKTTKSDASVVLNFGADSITVSGGGAITQDTVNGVSRPDNLKTNADGLAVLTLPEIDLKDSGYNKVELYLTNKNSAVDISVKAGGTEVAAFTSVQTSDWTNYKVYTESLTTTEASGNVTLNITGKAKTYAGNYVYVKFYNDGTGAKPVITAEPNTTAQPETSQDPDYLPYKDESLSFEERAADLVSRMTLEEKVAQLGYTAPAIPRLGVSAYNYWKECLHGVARQGQATNFPTSLSLSNTWNRDLIYKVADITSTEARAKNNKTNLSYYTPTINMARDPRWGRNDETYGEDPYLTGQLGGEFVKGMQGNDEKYLKIIATIKHFAANNNEANRRGGSSIMSEFNFRNYYLKVFKNVTEIEMPGSVMSSYNATSIYRNGELLYNYLPSAANTYLLTDILRRTWGFDGYVTTDCGAGDDLVGNTSYMNGVLGSTSAESCAYIAAALKAGMDVECNLSSGNVSASVGADAVLEGYITEQQLETNIYHLFLQRFRTGEFDSDPSYRDITSSSIETDENVAVAEEAAEESWVLLKNDENILPIKSAKNVAVVGNMANTLALGDYTGSPKKTTNPLTGMRTELSKQGTEVSYLGGVSDDEKLFNLKSLTLVMKDGSRNAVDLSKAENVSGMTLSNGVFTDITPKASAVIKNVNFLNVVSVEAEMSTGTRIGGSFNIAYGQGGTTVASINTEQTKDNDTYVTCSGEYTGEDGGYNGTADMYISASATALEFSVEAYKTQLDAADVIIAYAGTIPKQDGFGTADSSESKDRANIDLPSHQSHVQAICDAYPNKTVVVMSTVGQINVEPFKDKCKAILWTSYNGQTQGTALGKVLTGEVSPSGRLSTTWYKNTDVSKMELYNNTTQKIGNVSGKYTDYDIQADGTNPGHTYQYYSNTPIYPFGYGLSYTSFEYSNITIDKTSVDANGKVAMAVDVKNTGSVDGSEVVQLYVAHPQDGKATTPKKQLKGFEKIELAAGETKTVKFELDVRDMALYSESDVKNVVPSGTYTAYIGKNADDTSLSKTFDVSGTLDASLTTVKTMPDGVSLNAYISEDRTKLSPITTINANTSAVMYDESVYDISKADVKYESSNESVARVSDNGTVSSGFYEGTATITVSVTIDGKTLTDSFPVVNKLQVANDDIPYVIEKASNQKNSNVDVTLSYRGSTAATEVQLKAEVTGSDGEVRHTEYIEVKGEGKYTINTGATDGEKVIYTVVDKDGVNRSESFEAVYNEPVPSKIVAYYLENPDYDYTVLTGGTDKIKYDETVNGLSGYGAWNSSSSNADYTYVDVNDNEYSYSFTKAWMAGAGGTAKRCLYFTPEAPCKVTAVFYGSEAQRSMTIEQGSRKTTQEGVGAAVDLSLEVTDTSTPVYVYGGSSNKYLYAIIVEYYGMGEKEESTQQPSETAQPTEQATEAATEQPTEQPTEQATEAATEQPTEQATEATTEQATATVPPAEPTPTEGNVDNPSVKVTVTYDEADKTLRLKSNMQELMSAAVVRASYENGVLTGAEIYEPTFNAGTGEAEIADFELESGDKVFVWDSTATMIPYAEPFVYTPQGETIELQTASWNGENNIILTEDSVSGETKLWQVLIGNQRTELYTESFYSVPDGYPRDFENGYFKINSLAVYKDRLYAGCDGGFVIMLTSCVKCYQLKKPVDYDINEITIDGDYMVINNTERISMAELGADSTEADEARLMLQNGAVLIDVRTAEEYSEKAYEDSVNIPVDEIEEGIAAYEKDRVIIFCCASGVRAAAAVEKAKEMGYTNVYNLGSVDKLL